MTRTVYIARLIGRGGELDMISADSLETLNRHLGKRLLSRDWILADGDTIAISERQSGKAPPFIMVEYK